MNENTKASLLALLSKEAIEADRDYQEKLEAEEEGEFDDALQSMERTYAEGYSDALQMAIRLIEEAN